MYFEILSEVADYVAVAHPGLLTLIFRSKHKNDRRDALKLAKLLYIGEVPTVHVPSADVRAWRELITFRRKLVEKRTRAKNGIRGLLRSLGIQAPRETGIVDTCRHGLAGTTWFRQRDACLETGFAGRRDRSSVANSLRSNRASDRRPAPTKAPHSRNPYSIVLDPIALS